MGEWCRSGIARGGGGGGGGAAAGVGDIEDIHNDGGTAEGGLDLGGMMPFASRAGNKAGSSGEANSEDQSIVVEATQAGGLLRSSNSCGVQNCRAASPVRQFHTHSAQSSSRSIHIRFRRNIIRKFSIQQPPRSCASRSQLSAVNIVSSCQIHRRTINVRPLLHHRLDGGGHSVYVRDCHSVSISTFTNSLFTCYSMAKFPQALQNPLWVNVVRIQFFWVKLVVQTTIFNCLAHIQSPLEVH